MSAENRFSPFVHTLGEGPRRVLALHCTLGFGGAWNGMAKLLGDRLTFVAPDLPCHGKSPDMDALDAFSTTVFDSTLAMMDSAPMDVIGHSFGAMTALRLAARFPERIRTLTLFEPVFFAVARADAPETLAAHDNDTAHFREAADAGDMETAARAFNEMWSSGPSGWDALSERARQAMVRGIRVVPTTYALLYDDTDGILAPGVLDRVSMPVQLIRGALTHAAISSTLAGLQTRLPDAALDVIPDAGHMAPISHPAEVAALFEKVLARA